jgi:hypothetical protein
MMLLPNDNGRKGVSASEERWNEPKAILLLQRAGKLVQGIETSGTRMPQSDRELYHTRLVAAHDARDMAAYRIALEGYVEGARKAYRKTKKGWKGKGEAR